MQLISCLLFSSMALARASCPAERAYEHMALVQRQVSLLSKGYNSTQVDECDSATKKAAELQISSTAAYKSLMKFQSSSPALYGGKNGADCQLWDGDMQATKGFNIVVDGRTMQLKNNLPPCCGGKVPNDDPKVERPELGERHTHEGYTYYLVVPPKCKAKKCPLLVFFNFTSETGKITQMIDCPSCKEDMGVVALLPSWDQYMVTQPNFSMDGNYLTQSDIYGRSPSSGNIGLHDKFEKYLRGMVNQAIAENREFIDTSRVYVAGQSLAASAALYAALAMPDVFRKAFIYSPTDFGCPLMKDRLQQSLRELWKKHSSNRKLESISVFLGQADEASMDATTGRVGQGQGALDWGTAASLMQEIGVFDSVAVQFQLVVRGVHACGFNVNYKDYWES